MSTLVFTTDALLPGQAGRVTTTNVHDETPTNHNNRSRAGCGVGLLRALLV